MHYPWVELLCHHLPSIAKENWALWACGGVWELDCSLTPSKTEFHLHLHMAGGGCIRRWKGGQPRWAKRAFCADDVLVSTGRWPLHKVMHVESSAQQALLLGRLQSLMDQPTSKAAAPHGSHALGGVENFPICSSSCGIDHNRYSETVHPF